MAADANIFQSYLNPVKSVAEYSNELDKQEQNALTLAASRISNRSAQQAYDDNQIYRKASKDSGGDKNKLVQLLYGAGQAQQAQVIEASGIDLAHKQSQTAASNATAGKDVQATAGAAYDLDQKKRVQQASSMAALQSPDDAIAHITKQVQGGVVTPEQGQAAMQAVPRDPAAFAQWQLGHLKEFLTPKEQVALQVPDANNVNTNRTSVQNNQATNARTAADNAASRQVQMRGQNMTDARTKETNALTREGAQTQVINDPVRGPILVNKQTGVARNAVGSDGQPLQGEVPAKKQAAAKNLISVLDEADGLIDKATGSYIGAGVDHLGRAFGGATAGDQASARLKVLEGALMMNQPRMEGPQSDKDVMLYRQMAGQIGDSTVPASLKKSAMKSIRAMTEKYSNGSGSSGGAAALPATNQQGWSLHTDAKGNQAYVSPDGKQFQEVK